MEAFSNLHPILQAFLATVFTWFLTALGASTVFVVRGMDRRFLDGMLGFAAGVMLAASFWSLLAPPIEMAVGRDLPAWAPAPVAFPSPTLPYALSFAAGAMLFVVIEELIPESQLGRNTDIATLG